MFSIDPSNSIVLSMDFQNDIVTKFVPVAPELLERAGSVLAAARAAQIPIVHIVVQFRPGHPEIADRGLFQMVKGMNGLVEGTDGAAIHSAVAPQESDVVVTKRRVSAFAGSDLDCVLRGSGRTHLVLLGVATSGVVLSTVRAASDLDYDMHVVSDCCADGDAEVHACLIDKIFPRMAPSVTAAEFIAATAAAAGA